MNNNKSSDEKITENSSGHFLAKDKHDVPIIVEWEKTTVKEPSHSKNMNDICEVACKAYTDVEVRFLKKYPDVVENEDYYEQFRPLFKNGVATVDWKLVEEKMNARIKQMHEMDYSQFSADDIYFFVKARDIETNNLFGFATFLMKQEYPQSSVKNISIGLIPQAHGRGLGKLLMSSIFKIIPTVERIFLFTRVTNDTAIGAYKSWGFTEDLHPTQDPNFTFKKEHWASLEYKVENSDTLQKTARNFQSF